MCFIVMAVFVVRLFYLQVIEHGKYQLKEVRFT
jgi:cell division protein FtsI/penicillin-binding protein 2